MRTSTNLYQRRNNMTDQITRQQQANRDRDGYDAKLADLLTIAARTAGRLYAQATERWDECEACDAHYDGGEWSRPGWDKARDSEYQRILKLTSRRFGFPADLIANRQTQMEWDFQAHFFNAIGLAAGDTSMTDPEANR